MLFLKQVIRSSHLLVVLVGFIFSGCTITNLQRVAVDAPAVQHPVRITDAPQRGQLVTRGFLSYNQDPLQLTQIDQHTEVNARGVYEVEAIEGESGFIERAGVNVFPFRGDNFEWQVPAWQGGMEMEFPFSGGMAVTGGLGFSEMGSSYQMSQSLGLGFLFDSQTWGSRLDFNLNFQQSHFDVEAVRGRDKFNREDSDRRVTFLSFDDTDRYTNPSVGFTMNSKRNEWPVNYYFNYTLGRQTFYDVKNEFLFESGVEGFDFRYSESYNALTAGIYSNVADHGRMLLGLRWMKFTDERNQLALFKFFVQYDIVFR